MSGPLDQRDKSYLSEYSRVVRDTCTHSPSGIVLRENVKDGSIETTEMHGPAMEGNLNADTSWRIAFEKIHGEWRVKYLILAVA